MDRATLYASLDARLASYRRGAPHFEIGATTASQILGLAPWGGPWTVYARAHGYPLGDEDKPPTEAMERGQEWEPWLIDQYAQRHPNAALDRREMRVCHLEYPWLLVAPDVLVGDDGLVEAKSTVLNVDEHWGPDGSVILDSTAAMAATLAPPMYQIQGLMQLAATERRWVDFIVGFLPDGYPPAWPKTRVIRMFAQPALQDHLVSVVAAWRERHLVGDEQPPLDASPAANSVFARVPPTRDYIDAPDDVVSDILMYRDIGATMKDLKSKKAEVCNRIVAAAGEHKGFLLPEDLRKSGAKSSPKCLVQRNSGTNTVIDATELRRASPVLFEKLADAGLWRPAGWTSIAKANPDLARDLADAGLVRKGRPYAFPRLYNVDQPSPEGES